MRKISVIIKRPGKKPYHTYISPTLENLQKTVGGHIETFTFSKDACIICNEEGRINGDKYNCMLFGMEFFGTLIFVGVTIDDLNDYPTDFKTFKQMFSKLFQEEEK